MNKEYFYGLDKLRAIMMLFGPIYHAACYLTPYFQWSPYSELNHRSANIWNIISIETIFRMQTFFLVSGFLAAMLLSRRTRKEYILARIKRVFLPLILGLLLCNILQNLYFYFVLDLRPTFSYGMLIFHGWFLVVLFVFCILDLLTTQSNSNKIRLQIFLLIIFFIIGIIIQRQANKVWELFHLPTFIWQVLHLIFTQPLQYLFYYYLGKILYLHREKLHYISIKNIIYLSFFSTIVLFFAHISQPNISNLISSPYPYLRNIASALMSFSLFLIFYRYNSKHSQISQYLISSSIAIYILHHPLCLIIGYHLDFSPIRNTHWFILTVILVFLCSFAIFNCIRCYKTTRIMFGLK